MLHLLRLFLSDFVLFCLIQLFGVPCICHKLHKSMNYIIASLTLLILSAIAKATQDVISFKYTTSRFALVKSERFQMWANPALSWRNKYKNGDPKQGPRFPLATTLLVWVTDLFHLAQNIRITAQQLALALHLHVVILFVAPLPYWAIILDVILFKLAYGVGFVPFYRNFFIQSSKQNPMSYRIWKLIQKIGLVSSSHSAGPITVLIYLVMLGIAVAITYVIAPGSPQWKFSDTVPVWEWIAVIGFALWIVWSGWMLLWGNKKMEKRYKSEFQS